MIVISVKLWSENVEKSRKDNFTVVLLLFMKIWIFGKFGENFIRVDKIGLGWFGVVPEKLWSIYWKNHTFTAISLCSRIIYDSGPGFFFGAQRFVIPIFRFIGYLEHTYWYQNGASKKCGPREKLFRGPSSSETIL